MEFPCKDFKVGKCEGQKLVDGEMMPMVLLPPVADKADLESLVSALKKNNDWFEQMIIKNSAVLLRQPMCTKGCGPPMKDPSSELTYYHHEMILIKESPMKLVLFCEMPPPGGGETPFVPRFKETEGMLEFPEAVEEMEKKGLKYTFTALSKNDMSSMRGRASPTPKRLSSNLRSEICCRTNALGMDMEWLPNGGVKIVLGPRSTTRVFDGRKGRRMLFNTVVGMHGKEHTSALMADGTEIPDNVVRRCGEFIEEESMQFKWEKGDVLFFDSLALLHGRGPSKPPRRVLVATSSNLDYVSLVVCVFL
ncbi:hypothetical protein SLEP1_g4404 [Rubroshorea leprosula]|uniref:TauD/TfdA-like domain-containing protein n=1 Tax=Rubroshorea leprosula TaxID=152421 RepID=A0AAV5HP30_9ROSI|nr:hypothetical protein SLEP1_g4404 [Rubroshorea leprosula]